MAVQLPTPGQDPWGDILNAAINELDARLTAVENAGPLPPTEPVNSVLPVITGATTLSAVLTCSQGTWTNTPTGYTYQWKRDGTAISGETASTHTIVAADQGHMLTCTVTATNAGGSTSATTADTSVPAALVAPTNTAVPVVSGTTTLASVLTSTTGTWTGSPTGYTYQWKRGGTNIGGETANTHTIIAADQGQTLTCAVTATNAGGSSTATSVGTSIPLANAPANTVLPAITGTPTSGSTLTCSTGTWTGTPTGYTYQWKRNGANISAATASTYIVAAADISKTLTCTVTATNASGSTPATTTGLAIPNPNRQLFVMMGQSNMVGRGTSATTVSVAAGKGYVYNHQTGAITSGIAEPIVGANSGATSTNVSPVAALAKAYTDQVTHIPVINKSCKGNMYISEMNAGQPMYVLTVDSTNAAKAAIVAQGNTVTDVWGFWLQGESDAFGNMSETEYKTKLADLLDRLKVDCGITKMFVLRVGFDLDSPEIDAGTHTIMRAQNKICSERNDFIMIANINALFETTTVAPFTAPTMSPTDFIHYTSYGYEVEGAEAGNNLAYYVNTGMKPVLVENVPEVEIEVQPPTMVENRYDFTKGLTDEVGDKDFSVVGTGYTIDPVKGLRIPAVSSTNTHISLASSIVLDDLKDWAVEFEATLDTVTTITSAVGTPIGNRTGGIKDCIWFGIAADNSIAGVDTAGAYLPLTTPVPAAAALVRYKIVFVSSTKSMYLVVNGQISGASISHSGKMLLRYLFTGYDTNPTYIFKGDLKNLSVRYDVNYKVELPAIEPVVLVDLAFDETGIINNNPTANSLIVVPGREAGQTFAADGITMVGGEHSGYTFQNSILLNRASKWVISYHAHWKGPNAAGMGAGYSSSDGMLLADNTVYDWCYNGIYSSGAGGSINKGMPYYQQMRHFVITHDPGRSPILKIEIDGVTEWSGAPTKDWPITRFGAGYNIKKYGFPGTVSDMYIAVNTIDPTPIARTIDKPTPDRYA